MKGFTLIEILLTMSLVAIAAILSAPFYGQFIFSQETSIVSDELEGSFRKAQMYSIAGKNDVEWGVTTEGDRIILFQGSSYANRDQAFDEIYDIRGHVSISGFGEVIFSRITGRPLSTPAIVVSGIGPAETFLLNAEGVLEKQ